VGTWSKDEVTRILREAHEALGEAGVPEALQPIAFPFAVQMLSAKVTAVPVLGQQGRH
jgi:hypothetical protein